MRWEDASAPAALAAMVGAGDAACLMQASAGAAMSAGLYRTAQVRSKCKEGWADVSRTLADGSAGTGIAGAAIAWRRKRKWRRVQPISLAPAQVSCKRHKRRWRRRCRHWHWHPRRLRKQPDRRTDWRQWRANGANGANGAGVSGAGLVTTAGIDGATMRPAASRPQHAAGS